MKRGVFRLGALLATCLLGTGAVLASPAIGAYLCPGCYGLKQIEPGIYVDDVQAARHVPDMLTTARQRVAAIFPGTQPAPRWLVCTTQACDRRLGGRGTFGRAFGKRFIHLSPPGVTETIMTHEQFHAVFVDRIGRGHAPYWLEEGLAVIVSRDMRYLGKRCDLESMARLPGTLRSWNKRAGKEHKAMYRDAACRAQDWIVQIGGVDQIETALTDARW